MAQRYSYRRERIYQAVEDSREHPTAEMVYQQLKLEMPRLSMGTVYRNLQQMAREGRLTRHLDRAGLEQVLTALYQPKETGLLSSLMEKTKRRKGDAA